MPISKPITALTQQNFLDLAERILPPHYIDTIKQFGPGYEVFQAYAAIFERVGAAVDRLGSDSYIALAATGVKATGEVQLFRAGALSFGIPIIGQSGSAGSIVSGAGAGEMRVTGLTGMSTTSVGRFLEIQGAASPANNGTFEISSVNDATSVDVVNASAVVPDANNGTLVWEEQTKTVTVKAGTVVEASQGGQRFATLDDVEFGPTDVGPTTVAIEALAPGYEFNVRGQRTAADGTLLEGEIDTIRILVEDPVLGDTTIQVQQIDDVTGGTDPALAGLGRNRGLEQGSDEATDTYRARLGVLPDTISPDALKRTIADLLRPYGITFETIETFEITYQTAYDGPSNLIDGSLYDPNLFVYDDPADPDPFKNRWMDENDHRGGMIVIVENCQPIRDTSLVYDDVTPDIPSLVSSITGGQRAVCAYDVPQSVVASFGAVLGGYDGSDLPKLSLYIGLFETLQRIKPAGNSISVELKGE